MSAPLVSFLVPAFNPGPYLEECLRSILAQTYKRFEVLILDDASRDDTQAIAKQFSDPRITYVRRPQNLGLPRNFNLGLQQCRGDYVWHLAADDCLADSTSTHRALHEFEEKGSLEFICSPLVELGDKPEPIPWFYLGAEKIVWKKPKLSRFLIPGNRLCPAGILAKSELYRTVGLFPPDLPFVGDWYFWFRFGLLADAGYLPEPLAHYRIHGASLTSQFFGPRAWDRVIQYLKLHLAMRDLAGDLDGFLEEITLGLKSDMSQFLQVWMYHPHSRPSMLEALSGDLAVSTVPLRDRDFRPLLAQLLEKSATELLFQAITQGKPRLGLKSLLLRTQLPKILAAVREGK